MAANGIKAIEGIQFFPHLTDEKLCAWSSLTMVEVIGNSESMLGVNLFLPRVLYFPKHAIYFHNWVNIAWCCKIWKKTFFNF